MKRHKDFVIILSKVILKYGNSFVKRYRNFIRRIF